MSQRSDVHRNGTFRESATFAVVATVVVAGWVGGGCDSASLDDLGSRSDPLISDGAHQGNEHFYFLPPLVAAPVVSGTFDGTAAPRVEICELSGADCGAGVASFTMTNGSGGEVVRVSELDEHYIVNWDTQAFALDTTSVYRVSVLVESVRLGFADVMVATTGGALKNIETDEYVALKDGRTLPIKFRIEEDATACPDGDADGDGLCDASDPDPEWPEGLPTGVCAPTGHDCTAPSQCCSARCVMGADGQGSCEAIQGCKPFGELCSADADCCNQAGRCDDPTSVGTCELFPGGTIGRCGAIEGNLPAGAVCGDGANTGSQCCGGGETCKSTLDGVERCFGDASEACFAVGAPCSFRDQCCSFFCAIGADGNSVCTENPCDADTDGDGLCDDVDPCPSSANHTDVDMDGTPDGCDVCLSGPDTIDDDGDGVPDACDVCGGFDDAVDADADGVPDGCDACPSDPANDSDGDGICDGEDPCIDVDQNGVCDDEACQSGDPTVDSDGDGICDAEDPSRYWPGTDAPFCGAVGEACQGGNDCCSARCVVDAQGAGTCAPIEGCRPFGELCTSDADCCNQAGACNEPDSKGSCDLFDGTTVGRCGSIAGPQPAGSVCGDDGPPSGSQCCGGTLACGSTLDGVDRCFGDAATACYAAGEPCLFRDQCCSLTCESDGAGVNRCL